MRFISVVYVLAFILILFSTPVHAQTYLNENQTWQNNLEPVQWSKIVAGDINKDNLIDIIILGCNGGSGSQCTSRITKVYTNNGTSFVENQTWESNLTHVTRGSMSLGDINNDGDLDLILMGCVSGGGGSSSQCTSRITKVYTNNGTSFVENQTWESNLTQLDWGSTKLGDINNDGDLDLILLGEGIDRQPYSKVYINNGTSFVENQTWEQNLIDLRTGSLTLGDINNDGNLDLILSGEDINSQSYSKVYTNNGTSFVENQTWEQNLYGVTMSSLSLADYNNDGLLDLILMGLTDSFRLYRNNGSCFIKNQTDILDGQDRFVAIYDGSVAFGDYNNDGYLDLIGTGHEKYTTIYMYNKTNGNYTNYFDDPEQQIIDLEFGPSVIWTDVNNDRDLDIIITGWGGGGGGWFQAKVYTNNLSIKNNIPVSPLNFSANFSNEKLTLSWGNGSDTETPTLGLYYNLRVGTCSGCHDIVSGVFSGGNDNGYFGNMMQRKNIVLNRPDLENKTIYWAVQTIDTGLAKSAWPTEQVFHITQQCTENWTYGDWGSCSNGHQSRTATDSNDCGTTINRNAVAQSCSSTPSGGSPTGSSSPSPSVTVQNKSKIFGNVTWYFERIEEEVDTGFILNETIHAINQVWIKVKHEASEIYVDIKRLESRPSPAIKEPVGKVYQYLNITFWNLSATNVELGKIRFGVDKKWVENNSINKSTILLERYFNNDWQSLKTALSSEDDNDVYYLAETPGFSIFAITGRILEKTKTICIPNEIRCNTGTVEECSADGIKLILNETCEYGCENGKCEEKPYETASAQNYLWSIAAIVMIISAVGIIWRMMKSKTPRTSFA
jgi:PGF-pre-PGF domain-containing protein